MSLIKQVHENYQQNLTLAALPKMNFGFNFNFNNPFEDYDYPNGIAQVSNNENSSSSDLVMSEDFGSSSAQFTHSMQGKPTLIPDMSEHSIFDQVSKDQKMIDDALNWLLQGESGMQTEKSEISCTENSLIFSQKQVPNLQKSSLSCQCDSKNQ